MSTLSASWVYLSMSVMALTCAATVGLPVKKTGEAGRGGRPTGSRPSVSRENGRGEKVGVCSAVDAKRVAETREPIGRRSALIEDDDATAMVLLVALWLYEEVTTTLSKRIGEDEVGCKSHVRGI